MSTIWISGQTIVVLNLYCKIPFSKASSTNPQIIETANLIGRSANSVKMKIGNFGSFDENLMAKGIVGLANTSKLDKEVWNEFCSDWNNLAFESEKLIAQFENNDFIEKESELFNIPQGINREALVK